MYRMFLPAEPLRPFIECYWIARAPQGEALTLQENVFVDGKADILFNFGVSYQRNRLNIEPSPKNLGHSNVDAQRSYPVAIYQHGAVDLLSVRFRPGGLAAFLPIPIHELTDYAIDLSDGLGLAGHQLEGRLFDHRAEANHQIRLLDTFFLERLRVSGAQELAHAIARSIESWGGAVSIRDLSREFGYSIRSIDRFFRPSYGYSPKYYARVVRFHQALRFMIRNSAVSLLEIAFRCGYYDQSHFNKEFAAFTGSSPEGYRAFMLAKATTPPPNLSTFYKPE